MPGSPVGAPIVRNAYEMSPSYNYRYMGNGYNGDRGGVTCCGMPITIRGPCSLPLLVLVGLVASVLCCCGVKLATQAGHSVRGVGSHLHNGLHNGLTNTAHHIDRFGNQVDNAFDRVDNTLDRVGNHIRHHAGRARAKISENYQHAPAMSFTDWLSEKVGQMFGLHDWPLEYIFGGPPGSFGPDKDAPVDFDCDIEWPNWQAAWSAEKKE